ncbi:hypothetical protein BZL30_7404 [Mycobacterium kansasii]|uniref:Uncharacterized protein n=1 Tax=Mycobacterium kansasii TaxID=1768 RepID=A0A1V3WRI5_MYCKA|nr:hypothetical protein BZL30_7404 [Mycobacterium kansasii]
MPPALAPAAVAAVADQGGVAAATAGGIERATGSRVPAVAGVADEPGIPAAAAEQPDGVAAGAATTSRAGRRIAPLRKLPPARPLPRRRACRRVDGHQP